MGWKETNQKVSPALAHFFFLWEFIGWKDDCMMLQNSLLCNIATACYPHQTKRIFLFLKDKDEVCFSRKAIAVKFYDSLDLQCHDGL